MTVSIWDHDYKEPLILKSQFISSTRSTATFSIETNHLGFVYYSIADKHIPVPIYMDIRNNISNKNTFLFL